MNNRHLIQVLLPLLLIACSDDDSTVQPPVPLTPDEQVVADCLDMRDVLEKYASEHGGSYGEWNISLQGLEHENPYTGESEPSGIRAFEPGQIGLEEYACGGNVFGYRITGYGRDRMLITLESLTNVPGDLRYQQDVTVANALLVLDAARRFGADNDGEFSTDVAGDTDSNGMTLLDHLPNGQLLVNPFSSVKSEPEDGLAIAVPGGVGYIGNDSGSGIIDSFQIEAYGCNGEIILVLQPYRTYNEEYVWSGSYHLRAAVEEFAAVSGHFPHNLDAETTPGGKTVINIYSENTYNHPTDFVNPYTQQHYIPSIGIATGKGAIAYQPIETAGVVTDYVVTGRSAFDEIVRLGKKSAP